MLIILFLESFEPLRSVLKALLEKVKPFGLGFKTKVQISEGLLDETVVYVLQAHRSLNGFQMTA